MHEPNHPNVPTLALTLGGGGARAAFQVGVLRAMTRNHPELRISIMTGVSAGAINIAHLANSEGTFEESVDGLSNLWRNLRLNNVFRTAGPGLIWRAAKVGMRLSVGQPWITKPVHGMVDTQPLREYLTSSQGTSDGSLPGIDRNLSSGKLKGVALSTYCYATSETVIFYRGQEIKAWERPHRRSVESALTIDHVMASSALPLLFTPIRIGDRWYGDGGVRLNAPLSPGIQMGADRMIVISNHYTGPSQDPVIMTEAPSPASILSAIYNSVFLDQLDQDALHMKRINELITGPTTPSSGLRKIKLLVIRPTHDLGSLAFDLRHRVPPTLRFLLDRLGGNQRSSDDFLSTLLFHPDYIERLIQYGEQEGEARANEIAELLA